MSANGSAHPRAKAKARRLDKWQQDFDDSKLGPFSIEGDVDYASSIVSTSTLSEIDLQDSQPGPSTIPTTQSATSSGDCKGKSKEVSSEGLIPCKNARGEVCEHHASYLGQHVQDDTPLQGHAREVDIPHNIGEDYGIEQAPGHDDTLPTPKSQASSNSQPTSTAQSRLNGQLDPAVQQAGQLQRFTASFRTHYTTLDADTGHAISRRLSVLDSFILIIIFIFMIEAIWEIAHGQLWIIGLALLGAALDKYKNSAKVLRRTRNLIQLATSISWNGIKSALGACGVPGCAGSAGQNLDIEAGDGADDLHDAEASESGEDVPMLRT